MPVDMRRLLLLLSPKRRLLEEVRSTNLRELLLFSPIGIPSSLVANLRLLLLRSPIIILLLPSPCTRRVLLLLLLLLLGLGLISCSCCCCCCSAACADACMRRALLDRSPNLRLLPAAPVLLAVPPTLVAKEGRLCRVLLLRVLTTEASSDPEYPARLLRRRDVVVNAVVVVVSVADWSLRLLDAFSNRRLLLALFSPNDRFMRRGGDTGSTNAADDADGSPPTGLLRRCREEDGLEDEARLRCERVVRDFTLARVCAVVSSTSSPSMFDYFLVCFVYFTLY